MNILFLGDSLIEYYDWQERFPRHNAGNYGVAGESVGGLLSRVVKINEVFPSADRIFIMSGINNMAMDDMEFMESYRVILEKLKVFYPDAKIYIHSLLPTLTGFISNESVIEINHEIEKLSRDLSVEYVDMYSRFIDTGGRPIKEYLLDDGVHISRTGYDVWAIEVEKQLSAINS
jgi:lysophospholipase L1-like esterase